MSRDGAEVTSTGRSFHALATATPFSSPPGGGAVMAGPVNGIIILVMYKITTKNE